ncbi:MAG TPA: Uma2 family endonuclease [Beijerinckiaceae bacterium]|jgi:Uma2 family endonuclease|nr:Uma2 family endonuclease [Beijerinckiaceae bacterium]
MNVRTDVRMDKAQFFEWLEHQERKYELADGRVVMMPWVTRPHARISTNVVAALLARLHPEKFDIVQGDFAVETGDRSVRFADVLVEPFNPESARSTDNALLLVEVLSPSTLHIDFHEKLDEYKGLPALGTYLICAQDDARVWVWTRQDGAWPDAPEVLEGLDAIVQVPILGITLPLAEIYRNVTLL